MKCILLETGYCKQEYDQAGTELNKQRVPRAGAKCISYALVESEDFKKLAENYVSHAQVEPDGAAVQKPTSPLPGKLMHAKLPVNVCE